MATTTRVEESNTLHSAASKGLPRTAVSGFATQDARAVYRKRNEFAGRFLASCDLVLIGFLGCTAMLWCFHISLALSWKMRESLPIRKHLVCLACYCVAFVLIGFVHGLYSTPPGKAFATHLKGLLKTTLWASPLVISLIYLSGEKALSRMVIAITMIGGLPLLLLWRYVLRSLQLAGISDIRNVLIVGGGRSGLELKTRIEANQQLGLKCVGFVDGPEGHRDIYSARCLPILGTIEDLGAVISHNFVDEVMITVPNDGNLVREAAVCAQNAGAGVCIAADLYDGLTLGATVDYVGDIPTIQLHENNVPYLQLAIKRVSDVIISTIALVVLLPVVLLVAIAVKLDSRGPIFFHSVRIGKKGVPFTCYKFRTMVDDAEKLKKSLEHLNERDGVLFKIIDDPRITRLGKFLRKFSLDELPQFWNVLKGEMSLVGPRPPLQDEYDHYASEHFRRLDVAPGLTGLWQVKARQSPSFEDYINYDLKYIKNWNLWLDLKLIIQTIPVVIAGTGR